MEKVALCRKDTVAPLVEGTRASWNTYEAFSIPQDTRTHMAFSTQVHEETSRDIDLDAASAVEDGGERKN